MQNYFKLFLLLLFCVTNIAFADSEQEVSNYIKNNIASLVIPADDFLVNRGITPSLVEDKNFDTNRRIETGVYTDQYDWDTHFISKTMLVIDANYYKPIVQESILNFLALQSPEGFIPRTIGYDGIKDFPGHHKPFLFQTILLLEKNKLPLNWLTKEVQGFEWSQNFTQITDPASWDKQKYTKFFSRVKFQPLERLEKYLDFYIQYRKVPKQNLYAWNNILESGIDTTLALRPRVYAPVGDFDAALNCTPSPVPNIAAIDLNIYLYNEFNAASKVFELLKNKKKSAYYAQKAQEIKEQFVATFWNEKDSLFYNRYFKANGQSEFIDIPAWMSFLPLSAEQLIDNKKNPEMAKSIIQKHLLSSDSFLTPFGIRSLSRLSPVQGGDSGRALVPEYWFEAANWNGPIWVLPNLFAIEILQKYHYTTEAQDLKNRINTLLAQDIQKNKMMHEQYSYLDGRPGWAKSFISWNSCMFILNSDIKK